MMEFLGPSQVKRFDELITTCLVFATTGFLAHTLFFVRGNHNKRAFGIAVFHLVAGASLYTAFIVSRGVGAGVYLSTAACLLYLSGLFISTFVYRIWFHPLAKFPGPFTAKITKFYGPWIARNGRMHWEHTKISDTYGNIARIAPNELLLRSVDAIQKVHSSQSNCSKVDTFYEFITYKGVPNLDSITHREQHRWRRQVWDRALNSKALDKYERSAREVTNDWLLSLSASIGRPVNTSLYALLIPFDNIGKVGYSHNFGTVNAGRENRMVDLMETNFKAAGDLGQLAWPLGIVQRLGLSRDATEFDKMVVKLANKRVKEDSDEKEDIMKYMIEDLRSAAPKSFFNKDVLFSDASIIMVGGTDTIAVVLSYAFYELAKHPARQAKLRQAVASSYGKTLPGCFVEKDLETVEYLDALINELLRVYSPVCNNGQRTTPPDGIFVDGTYIPGGTNLVVPVHSIHRYEKFYEYPDEFIVERWTTRPELIREKGAFHPFLIGPFNCVGKRLALCLVRQVLASTVWHYGFKFATGEKGLEIHDKAVNQLILKAGPLYCEFEPRSGNSYRN